MLQRSYTPLPPGRSEFLKAGKVRLVNNFAQHLRHTMSKRSVASTICTPVRIADALVMRLLPFFSKMLAVFKLCNEGFDWCGNLPGGWHYL